MREYIGHYKKGEAPLEPLQYQFLDADGLPLDISSHTAVTFSYTTPAGVKVAGGTAAIVSAWNGVVAVDWTAALTAAVGQWEGEFRLTPGPVASVDLVWAVTDSSGAA